MNLKRVINLAFIVVVALTFYNCDDIVEVEDISNQTVTILAPTDNAGLTTTNIVFNWEAVVDADSYNIQIATPTFMEALQIVEDSTTVNTNFSKTLELGNYEWRVKAKNSAYETAFTTQSFIIE